MILSSIVVAVQYISDHEGLGLSDQKYHPKPASQYLHGTLTVLVGYNQAQNAFSMT